MDRHGKKKIKTTLSAGILYSEFYVAKEISKAISLGQLFVELSSIVQTHPGQVSVSQN